MLPVFRSRRVGGLAGVIGAAVVSVAACGPPRAQEDPPRPPAGHQQSDTATKGDSAADLYLPRRLQMVDTQIAARGVERTEVLQALRQVPRHLFVPAPLREQAYNDHPLPIGHEQTISQPYIVGLMSELAHVGAGDRVLEIGTGSGYQAAVLAAMGCQVFSIEIVEPLAAEASARLASLGYESVQVRAGDGYAGWPEEAPFDAVVITAAPPRIPEPLLEQLAVGGTLVVPVGDLSQELTVVKKTAHGLRQRAVLPVRFVPMTGEVRKGRP